MSALTVFIFFPVLRFTCIAPNLVREDYFLDNENLVGKARLGKLFPLDSSIKFEKGNEANYLPNIKNSFGISDTAFPESLSFCF